MNTKRGKLRKVSILCGILMLAQILIPGVTAFADITNPTAVNGSIALGKGSNAQSGTNFTFTASAPVYYKVGSYVVGANDHVFYAGTSPLFVEKVLNGPSQINGSISVTANNGNALVFHIDPAGGIFGPGVSVPNAFIFSTLPIQDNQLSALVTQGLPILPSGLISSATITNPPTALNDVVNLGASNIPVGTTLATILPPGIFAGSQTPPPSGSQTTVTTSFQQSFDNTLVQNNANVTVSGGFAPVGAPGPVGGSAPDPSMFATLLLANGTATGPIPFGGTATFNSSTGIWTIDHMFLGGGAIGGGTYNPTTHVFSGTSTATNGSTLSATFNTATGVMTSPMTMMSATGVKTQFTEMNMPFSVGTEFGVGGPPPIQMMSGMGGTNFGSGMPMTAGGFPSGAAPNGAFPGMLGNQSMPASTVQGNLGGSAAGGVVFGGPPEGVPMNYGSGVNAMGQGGFQGPTSTATPFAPGMGGPQMPGQTPTATGNPQGGMIPFGPNTAPGTYSVPGGTMNVNSSGNATFTDEAGNTMGTANFKTGQATGPNGNTFNMYGPGPVNTGSGAPMINAPSNSPARSFGQSSPNALTPNGPSNTPSAGQPANGQQTQSGPNTPANGNNGSLNSNPTAGSADQLSTGTSNGPVGQPGSQSGPNGNNSNLNSPANSAPNGPQSSNQGNNSLPPFLSSNAPSQGSFTTSNGQTGTYVKNTDGTTTVTVPGQGSATVNAQGVGTYTDANGNTRPVSPNNPPPFAQSSSAPSTSTNATAPASGAQGGSLPSTTPSSNVTAPPNAPANSAAPASPAATAPAPSVNNDQTAPGGTTAPNAPATNVPVAPSTNQ